MVYRGREDASDAKATSLGWRDKYEEADQAREAAEARQLDSGSLSFVLRLGVQQNPRREMNSLKQRLKTKEHVSDKWKQECETATHDLKHLQRELESCQVELERTRRDAETPKHEGPSTELS